MDVARSAAFARRAVGTVLQDDVLFAGSVADNRLFVLRAGKLSEHVAD